MQRTLTLPPVDSPEVESNPVFNVLMAYEDFETGKHAKETYDFLGENLGKDCQLTNQMWKFDVLTIPKLREIAVRDATMADIILISCHGNPLPEQVLKWMESWLMEGTHALALVALVGKADSQEASVSDVRQYLADVATRGHMEFFAQPDLWPHALRGHARFQLNHNTFLAEQTLSSLDGSVHRDITPRWGINE